MKYNYKKMIAITCMVCMMASMLTACSETDQEKEIKEVVANEEEIELEKTGESETIILYTNDVHAYINNSYQDDNDNEIRGLSYASVAALKQELSEQGHTVYLVDAGDHMQGSVYGQLDEGRSVINLMNAAGYDLAVPGDHDLDYGMYCFLARVAKAEFPYVSCDFYEVSSGETVLPAYQVIERDGKRIAFVGIMTPESWDYVQNSNVSDGENLQQYDFYGMDHANSFYKSVQKVINAAKKEADYVIAIGHTGEDESAHPYCSTDIIANVKGLDAYIDGHSHNSVDMQLVADEEGKEIPLTQAGSEFSAIGKMTISDKGITTELITEYEGREESVEQLEDQWIQEVEKQLGKQIASSEIDFCISDPEHEENRLIRRMETNLADLTADSIYYYFNEVEQMSCDVAFTNGGGIRAGLSNGEITYENCRDVCPFGNFICMVKVTGQDIVDALEWASAQLGVIDEEGNDTECGFLLHAAGLKYIVDTTIESSCVEDDRGMWSAGPTGEYRVKDVEIYNRELGEYEPVDLEKKYNVASYHYLLRNNGGGLAMFEKAELIRDYVGEDAMILAEYLKSFTKEEGEDPILTSQNSPLFEYPNYQLNYENIYGSGRLKTITTISY